MAAFPLGVARRRVWRMADQRGEISFGQCQGQMQPDDLDAISRQGGGSMMGVSKNMGKPPKSSICS